MFVGGDERNILHRKVSYYGLSMAAHQLPYLKTLYSARSALMSGPLWTFRVQLLWLGAHGLAAFKADFPTLVVAKGDERLGTGSLPA